ncbi:MAG: hypothetical protein QF903_09505 [Planctomycetota bacterium]|jgi:hypothetical protein|nr:hypothetical protein [Planctomycetota bacterium]MDP6763549.1 hypothetical protein [Planctomycetota bacterium]MDP6989700.1 hypothetical protein [Planctomycetota bacterium]
MIRLCCALSLPLFAPAAAAEGLLQLSFQGAIHAQGGSSVEVEVGVWDGGAGKARTIPMHLHLAEGTTAYDLASLVGARLRAGGARVVLPQEGSVGREAVHVFIEGATRGRLRLGGGIWGTATSCEAAPQEVRFLAPLVTRDTAQIHIGLSTYHPHTKSRGRKDLTFEAEAALGAARLSELLCALSIRQGLRADRPGPEGWHASRLTDGSMVTGCSVQLLSPDADWGIEMVLGEPPPTGDTSVPR